jgi:hypothetical protein
VSGALLTPFRGAPLLLGGELGWSFRSLTPEAISFSERLERPDRKEDRGARIGQSAGELGCDFRRVCSPSSVPE